MSAELTIKLVDATPDEQAAQDRPRQTPEETEAKRRESPNYVEAPPVQTADNRLPGYPTLPPKSGVEPPPIQPTKEKVEEVQPKGQESKKEPKRDDSSKVPSADQSQEPKQASVSISDVLDQLQRKLDKSMPGRQVNKVIGRARGVARRVAKQAKASFDRFARSEIGRKVMPTLSKVGKAIKASKAGQAVAKAGSSMLGAAGRALGMTGARVAATAATGAATAGTAATGAAATGAGTAAAGAGVAAVASNPVTATVGAVVVALAALPVAVAAAAYGIKRFGDLIVSLGDNVADKSAAMSAARGRQEISTELNMMKRAQQIGPEMAQMINAQTRFNDATQQLWTRLLDWVVKIAPYIEAASDGVTALIRGVDLLAATGEVIAAELTLADGQDDIDAAKSFAKAKGNFDQSIKDVFKTDINDPDPPDPFLMDLLR